MKTSLKISILFLLCGLNLFAQDADDLKIMKMMNDLRNEQGVKPLKFHPKLDSIANSWAKYIANELRDVSNEEVHQRQKENPKYLHIDFKNRAMMTKLVKGISCITISENIAFSSGIVPENLTNVSFIAWKNSPRHYSQMIDSDNSHFGFSTLTRSDGRVLYVTVFANVIE